VQGWALSAFSDVARVPVENVRFVPGKYPPIEKCFKQKICLCEVHITADTTDQQVAVEAWISSIREAVESRELSDRFGGYGFFSYAELTENIAQLLEYNTNSECPNQHGQGFSWTASPSSSFAFESWGRNTRSRAEGTKVPQVYALYGSWQNREALRGVPELSAMEGSGINGNASASCLHMDGSHDGDKIVYNDAYTLSFTYSAFLEQTSEQSDDPDLVAGVTVNAQNATNSTDLDSAGTRARNIECASGRRILGALVLVVCSLVLLR
jgi:hypothetical protein